MRWVARRVVRAVLVAAMSVGCAGSTRTSAPSTSRSAEPGVPTSPDLREQIARSCAVGRQLYVLDKVSAIATDVVLAQAPDPHGRGVAGYIPLQQADADGRPSESFVVSFFTREQPPRVAYEVVVAPEQKPRLETFEPAKETSDAFALLVRARQLAIAAMPKPVQPINPVLLPGEAIGERGIAVYLLAGTTRPDIAVLGRHFRVLVSEDGTRVERFTPLSNAVIEIPMRAPAGASAESLAVTHVVTDYPLETHVFASLLTKLPIHVGTRRGMWRVDGDQIVFLGEHGAQTKSTPHGADAGSRPTWHRRGEKEFREVAGLIAR